MGAVDRNVLEPNGVVEGPDVDDRSSVLLVCHHVRRGAGKLVRQAEVDSGNELLSLARGFKNGLAPIGTGIVNEDVYLTECGDSGLDNLMCRVILE